MKSNLNYKITRSNLKPKRPLTSKNIPKKSPKILAIEEAKKIYQNQGVYPNSKFLKQLNTDKLDIYLNILNPSDILAISKILSKYTYFQQITLSPFEPKVPQSSNSKSSMYSQKNRNSKSLGKPSKKKNNIKESDKALFKQKLFSATEKNLIITKNLLSLALISFKIDQKLAKILSKGIIDNKTLQYFSLNNSVLSVESFEILLKGILSHEIIRFLDLSNNKFNDNYCPMISRIIQRQAQRRDQIVWSYQLRNELPSDNNYKIGLISLNLHGNYLGAKSAKLISDSLNGDQYIRYIDLSKNLFDNSACKLFVHMMRKNNTLLTVDLRDNSGYDEFINPRIVMKMSKNIKYLYSQYQSGEYTEEEFEYLKGFIDISFFDVDIPQEIVQYYNNNIQKNTENINNNIINNNNIEKKNNIKEVNDENMNIINNPENKNNMNEDKKNINIKNNINDNNNIIEKEELQNNDNIKSNKTNINKNINKFDKNKINNLDNNAYQKNQNLIQENLKLKQEILELKAQNLQNMFTKEVGVPNPNKEEKDLENYYNRANEIIDTLNAVMAKLQQYKDKDKNDLNNKDNNNLININEINNLIQNNKNALKNEDKNINNEIKENKEIKDNNNITKPKTEIKTQNNNDNANKNKIIIDNKKNEEKNKINEKPQINNNNENKKDLIIKEKPKEEKKVEKEIQLNNDKEILNNKQEKNIIKDDKKNKELKEQNKHDNNEELNNNEEEEDEGDFNFDNLTEEEKIAFIQQRELLMKLQEEAEARGEHFDFQEYLAQLAEQSEEEDGDEQQNNKSNKLNKSF